jgi:hypothetical protein
MSVNFRSEVFLSCPSNENPVVVYLDQCAISEIAINRKACPQYGRLRDLLRKGHQCRQIICPVAKETITETTGIKSSQDRLEVQSLHQELAEFRGRTIAFKSIADLLNEESLAIARSIAPPSKFCVIRWHNVGNDKLNNIASSKQFEAKQRAVSRVLSLKSRRPLEIWDFEHARYVLVQERVAQVVGQLDRLAAGLLPSREKKMSFGFDLACYLHRQGLTKEELATLKHSLLNRRWETIPAFLHHNLLCAKIEAQYRTETPRVYKANDEIDVARMAVAMPSSALCITDKSMAALCCDTNKAISGLAKKKNVSGWRYCKVVSISEANVAADFVEELMNHGNRGKAGLRV